MLRKARLLFHSILALVLFAAGCGKPPHPTPVNVLSSRISLEPDFASKKIKAVVETEVRFKGLGEKICLQFPGTATIEKVTDENSKPVRARVRGAGNQRLVELALPGAHVAESTVTLVFTLGGELPEPRLGAWTLKLRDGLLPAYEGRADFVAMARLPAGYRLFGPGDTETDSSAGTQKLSSPVPIKDPVLVIAGPDAVLDRFQKERRSVSVLFSQENRKHAAKWADAAFSAWDCIENLFGPCHFPNILLVEADTDIPESASSMIFFPSHWMGPHVYERVLVQEMAKNWLEFVILPQSAKDIWLTKSTPVFAASIYSERYGPEAGAEHRERSLCEMLRLLDKKERTQAENEEIIFRRGHFFLLALRERLGDDERMEDVFSRLIEKGRAGTTSTDDFQRELETAWKGQEADLIDFFHFWHETGEIPELRLSYSVKSEASEAPYRVAGTLLSESFSRIGAVTIGVKTPKGLACRKTDLTGGTTGFVFPTDSEPLSVAADPYFEAFFIDPARKKRGVCMGIENALARGDIRAARRVILQTPSDIPWLDFLWGMLQVKEGQDMQAEKYFRNYLAGPGEGPYLKANVLLALGSIYEAGGQDEKARDAYRKILALDAPDFHIGALKNIAARHLDAL